MAIYGSSYCHGNLVAMANEKYFYSSVNQRDMNFVPGRQITSDNGNKWHNLLVLKCCNDGKSGIRL